MPALQQGKDKVEGSFERPEKDLNDWNSERFELVHLTASRAMPASVTDERCATLLRCEYPSTVVRLLWRGHSMTVRLFFSSACAVTGIENAVHFPIPLTCLPASSLPLLSVDRNFVVMSG